MTHKLNFQHENDSPENNQMLLNSQQHNIFISVYFKVVYL